MKHGMPPLPGCRQVDAGAMAKRSGPGRCVQNWVGHGVGDLRHKHLLTMKNWDSRIFNVQKWIFSHEQQPIYKLSKQQKLGFYVIKKKHCGLTIIFGALNIKILGFKQTKSTLDYWTRFIHRGLTLSNIKSENLATEREGECLMG